jgi:hypothetical protein
VKHAARAKQSKATRSRGIRAAFDGVARALRAGTTNKSGSISVQRPVNIRAAINRGSAGSEQVAEATQDTTIRQHAGRR